MLTKQDSGIKTRTQQIGLLFTGVDISIRLMTHEISSEHTIQSVKKRSTINLFRLIAPNQATTEDSDENAQ